MELEHSIDIERHTGEPKDNNSRLNGSPVGRPKGFDGTKSRMPSALAQAFKRAGLDWRVNFADAIRANNRERIKLWLRLLPYLITTSHRAKVKKWKGKASKAALIALEAMEQDTE